MPETDKCPLDCKHLDNGGGHKSLCNKRDDAGRREHELMQGEFLINRWTEDLWRCCPLNDKSRT